MKEEKKSVNYIYNNVNMAEIVKRYWNYCP